MINLYCDIEGTYNCLNNNEKQEFVNTLNKLNKKIIFSFISTASIKYVKEYVDDFKKYINNTNITLGIQIGDSEYINLKDEIKPVPCDYSKAIKMIYFQESLELGGDNIDTTIYIDNHPNMYPLIFTMDSNIEERLNNDKLKFILIEKNEEGLNYCKNSITTKNVTFISINEDNFMLKGLKQLVGE